MQRLRNIIFAGRKKSDVSKERRIHPNYLRNSDEPNNYANNQIRTSKYNFVTFFPVNLFEQFQRAANLYFLLQIVIMSIPAITALNPLSTAVPLMVVILTSMVKDGYDDYGRHKSDNQLNNMKSSVLNEDGHFVQKKWQEIHTGDIVKVSTDESVPADIVALSTSEESGLCFIETAELDGETNLKVRQPLPETVSSLKTEEQLISFKGEVVCEQPNNRLDKFDGNLCWNGQKFSLDNNNIVLRGCVLRNTQWIYGMVVYAGQESKIMMNSGKGIFKRTKLDRMTNYLIIWIALLLALICTFLSIMTYVFESDTGEKFKIYLPWENFYKNNAALIAVINWPGFIMVLNTLIPISLYISMEIIRFGQSLLINWDKELYHKETDTPAMARNTTLTEELGQIQYIFSDKTGTLTQNVMMFKECSINGNLYGKTFDESGDDIGLEGDKVYVDFSGNKYADPTFKFTDQSLKDSVDNNNEESVEFFRLLALCHTVMVEEKDKKGESNDLSGEGIDYLDFIPGFSGKMRRYGCKDTALLEYQAQSPDEGALVTAARNFGVVFKSRTPKSITIEVNGVEEEYELLYILDFDNVRKRMSVIVRKDGRIMLYCKGADTAIYELLSDKSKSITELTQKHLDTFACAGLRTLCLASRELSETEFKEWMILLDAARTALEDRDQKLYEVYCELEKDLDLLGATAIEDKLQDGAPECIASLAEANIKIWVLTGDKQETAINIGYSSFLLSEDMEEVFIISGEDENKVRDQIQECLSKVKPELESLSLSSKKTLDIEIEKDIESSVSMEIVNNVKKGYALVISGKSLSFALMKNIEKDFLDLALVCKAVICCRVTPLQKALVVELVKHNVQATTLAIGDGANDVSMIKAAHIGVGISGKEGRQAVLAADYTFSQFRFLQRLLLVHGRWSYLRMSKFLNYFFYKNFAFTLVQFWYNLFAAYSAATLYDAWFLAVYNVCFTSLPVLCMGIFDQDVSDKQSLQFPKLYIPGQKNILFNKFTFMRKLFHGILTSIILYFFPYGAYLELTNSEGLSHDQLTHFAVAVGAILVIVVNIQMALDTSHWTWLNHFFIWGSIIFYFLYTFTLYSTTIFALSPLNFPAVGAAVNTFGSGTFWAMLFLVSVICLLPVVGYRWVRQKKYPTLADRIRKGAWKQKSSLLSSRRSQRINRSRPQSHRSAFAFSQQSGFGELIMSGKWLPKFQVLNKKSRSFDVNNE